MKSHGLDREKLLGLSEIKGYNNKKKRVFAVMANKLDIKIIEIFQLLCFRLHDYNKKIYV